MMVVQKWKWCSGDDFYFFFVLFVLIAMFLNALLKRLFTKDDMNDEYEGVEMAEW